MLEFRAACQSNDTSIVSNYLKAGGDVNAADVEGVAGLHLSATAGSEDVLQLLAAHPGVLIDTETAYGVRAIHRAAGGLNVRDNPACVCHLVQHGADPVAKTTDGWTPLHFALFWGNRSIVMYLLSLPSVAAEVSGSASTPPPEVAGAGSVGLLTVDDAKQILSTIRSK